MSVAVRTGASIIAVVMLCVIFVAMMALFVWNLGDEIHFNQHNARLYSNCQDPLFVSDLGHAAHVCEETISRYEALYSARAFVATISQLIDGVRGFSMQMSLFVLILGVVLGIALVQRMPSPSHATDRDIALYHQQQQHAIALAPPPATATAARICLDNDIDTDVSIPRNPFAYYTATTTTSRRPPPVYSAWVGDQQRPKDD